MPIDFHGTYASPQSKFETFVREAEAKGDSYRVEIKGNGGFDYAKQVVQLIDLSNKINGRLLCYLFGDQLGNHLAEKYLECGRNLLTFLGRIDNEYRFFILHELKTDDTLFAHC